MWELDLVIRTAGISAGTLDEPFLINLYYLGRVRSRLGAKTTVEQLCGLVDDVNTGTQFTQLYEKRADGLYQRSFLNSRVIQPLDPAFDVAFVAVPGPTVEKVSGHRPVILSALGVSDADLDGLVGLTRASDLAPYITDDLTLGNLSFLWRHAWLSKTLKIKVGDWPIVLKLVGQDVASVHRPQGRARGHRDHRPARGHGPSRRTSSTGCSPRIAGPRPP